jgi:hypothetical protein
MPTTAPLPSDVHAQRPGPRVEERGDEELARLVGEADEAAFAILYERRYQELYRHCHSIVRDDLDAQDALQSAWTSALVALRRGRRDAPVRPWLYQIVHNEAISALRRRRQGNPPPPAPGPGAPSAEEHASTGSDSRCWSPTCVSCPSGRAFRAARAHPFPRGTRCDHRAGPGAARGLGDRVWHRCPDGRRVVRREH